MLHSKELERSEIVSFFANVAPEMKTGGND